MESETDYLTGMMVFILIDLMYHTDYQCLSQYLYEYLGTGPRIRVEVRVSSSL